PESIPPRAPIQRMTSNLKRRNDKRQPCLGAYNKQSISIEMKIHPNTKQMSWFPDHAPSSLSGMTLKARHFHNQKARHSGRA
ncbi:hypothetical protein ACT0UU_003518, partial [Vibrio vulnificus]